MRTFALGFFAGIAVLVLMDRGELPFLFKGAVAIIGGLVTFVLELGVVAGIGGVLLLIGAAFVLGRE